MAAERPILGLDTASPQVSIALGTATRLLGERTLELRRSSERLLAEISSVLDAAGLSLRDLAGCAVLRGPGSFTGLRVGLATALGFHQALGLPAAGLPTLQALALSLGGQPSRGTERLPIVAMVDALRGDWYLQRFEACAPGGSGAQGVPRPLAEPELMPTAALHTLGVCRFVGFGAEKLGVEHGIEHAVEPGTLARWAVRLAATSELRWDVASLSAPIYFRPPAVTPARTA